MGVILLLSPTTTATSAAASIHLFQSQSQSPPLLRGVFPTTRGRSSERGGVFSISTRTHICFPQKKPLFFFRVKSSSSTVDRLQNFRVVVPTENDQVKAVLTMFLKEEIGLSNEAVAATISNSVPFIDHLIARLHSIHKTRYLVGRKLTTLEIRNALIPYLEYLCEEHGDSLDDLMENFQNPPNEERQDHHRHSLENSPNPPEEELQQHISEEGSTTKLPLNSKKLKAMARMTEIGTDGKHLHPKLPLDSKKLKAMARKLPLSSKKLKAMARMTEIGTDGQLHPNTLYLLNMGLDMNKIKEMARRFPTITKPSWGRYARSLVEFLLDLGVPPANIPNIFYKTPYLCWLSLSKNIIPSMAYLETLGVDKSKWAMVIHQSPRLLAHSRQKVAATVDFLYELGLSRDRIGKVLTKFPQIISYSIDDGLRPKAEYFRSMGVNLTSLFSSFPDIFILSIECKMKPVTEFFLDKGFSIDEIGSMASRFGAIYRYSLTENLIPKWDFFLTMDYSRSELVKFPTYFGLSLEKRIKPRYAQVKECGVKLSLRQLLATSDSDYPEILNRMKIKKLLEAQQDSMAVASDEDLESNKYIPEPL